jgi:tRNA-specific 2-thiouridylase
LIAKKQSLVTAEKKDSQGLCFVGKVKLPEFLQQKLSTKEGKIIIIPKDSNIYSKKNSENISYENLYNISKSFNYSLNDGNHIGNHSGAHFFTVGQRKGLSIGGTKEPLFVLKTDVKNNIIFVGEGKEHPGLYRKTLFISQNDLHFVRTDIYQKKEIYYKVKARIRYRQPLQNAFLLIVNNGAFLIFDKKQSSVAKGQFAVWYKNKELLGSGIIN